MSRGRRGSSWCNAIPCDALFVERGAIKTGDIGYVEWIRISITLSIIRFPLPSRIDS